MSSTLEAEGCFVFPNLSGVVVGCSLAADDFRFSLEKCSAFSVNLLISRAVPNRGHC